MPSKTDFLEDAFIDLALRGIQLDASGTAAVALFTAIAGAEAGSVTEVVGAGSFYARQSGSFLAPVDGATSNSVALTFAQAGTNWGDVLGFGIYNSIDTGSGDLYYVGLLGEPPENFISDDVANDFLTAPSHSLVEDDEVRVATTSGGSLPQGLSEDVTYFVSASIASPNHEFALSTTLGGGAINLTTVGSGVFVKLNTRTIQANDTAEFAAGSLAVSEI